MKNLFTTILFAIVTVFSVSAQQMLVEKNGQVNEIISLDNLKQITFDGVTVNIEQTDGTRSNTSMEYIDRIHFGDFSSIEDITQKKNLIEYISRDEIAINCPAGTVVTIFNVIGSQIINTRIDSEQGHISIASLPQGIYIVKANDQTAKIIKR